MQNDSIGFPAKSSETEGDEQLGHAKLAFEREKWDEERRRASTDLALKEREVAFKESEARRARWWNPLAIAILGGAIAAMGNAYVSSVNSNSALEVEAFKAEASRILEVVKTGDPDKAAENLSFLLNAGLIQSSETAKGIRTYLTARKQGEGIFLPQLPLPLVRDYMQALGKVFEEFGKQDPGALARAQKERDACAAVIVSTQPQLESRDPKILEAAVEKVKRACEPPPLQPTAKGRVDR